MDEPVLTDEEKALAEKKKQAMLAMEGEEGRRHREDLERKKQEEELKIKLEDERTKVGHELERLASEKEKLELKWVELNEIKAPLEKSLEPIVTKEAQVEKEESDIEKKEHSTSDPVERQATEKMRWEVEDRRRLVEKERWRMEDEIGKVNAIIKTNSDKYQELLAEEEKSQKRLDEINKNLSVYNK
ncbi:MAG: hypothetical protein HY225_01480 [Candidatus Vogelbacteria bacterium]|nr:hypothetical protein [Candidatus Vogelbacteria bacterium]